MFSCPEGYNLRTSGDNSLHSDESKKKMSALNKGTNNPFCDKKHTQKSIKKISLSSIGKNKPMYGKSGNQSPSWGKRRSALTCAKMSATQKGKNNPNYGKIPSDETRKKISDGNKRRYKLKCTTLRKSVVIEGIFYESITAAGMFLGIGKGVIQKRLVSKSDKFKNWNYVTKQTKIILINKQSV